MNLRQILVLLAVRERFELSRRVTPTYRISNPAPSATWVPHHGNYIILDFPQNTLLTLFSKPFSLLMF